MQESPVRAEARHHPHSLRPEELFVCVWRGVCVYVVGRAGGKGTMNVKRREEVRMEEGQVRKRRTRSE